MIAIVPLSNNLPNICATFKAMHKIILETLGLHEVMLDVIAKKVIITKLQVQFFSKC